MLAEHTFQLSTARLLRRALVACALVLSVGAAWAEPVKVILDTDPGIDDALAVLVALASPELDVVGITSSFGNASIEQATVNALKLVEISGRNVPVARGAERPLHLPPPPPDESIHGADSLGDVGRPSPLGRPVEPAAAQFIVETARRHPGAITLVALGPLTNLAHALALEPELPTLLGGVVVMGGAARVPGNMSPVAEFNVYSDPHAADVVFATLSSITMVGLDVTQQVLLEDGMLERVAEDNPSIGQFLYAATRIYRTFYDSLGITDGLLLHDPTAVAYLIDPSLFTVRPGRVRVDTEGVTVGQTVAALGEVPPEGAGWAARPEVGVCLEVDGAGVVDLVVRTLSSGSISGR